MNKGDLIKITTEKDIGKLSDLNTSDKTNIVNAINELSNKSDLLIQSIDPTPEDKDYKVGQMWFNKQNGELFIFMGFDNNLGVWSAFKNNRFISDNDDMSGSAGSKKIKIGDMKEGYFGSVTSDELMSNDELSKKLGVTQGYASRRDAIWHKFAYKGKVLFYPQTSIRHEISWDYLNAKGLVFGEKTIDINDVTYKVRLIKGANSDPADTSSNDSKSKSVIGSEYNRLILPLHYNVKNNSWKHKDYVDKNLQDWETYLTNDDFHIDDYGGVMVLCQESIMQDNDKVVNRGNFSLELIDESTKSKNAGAYLWKPILEVVIQ